MDARSRVQLINGDLFYSPNCARDINLPGSEDVNELRSLLLRGGLTMESLQDPRWWAPQSEYLAFIPCSPVFFVGALLEVLSLVPRKMDYREEEGYMMPPLLRNQWLVIDEMLTKATEEIGNKHSLTYYRPHPPHLFHYHKVHPTQRKARSQVVAGRDWFAVWIGLLYWMISRIKDPGHIKDITPPL